MGKHHAPEQPYVPDTRVGLLPFNHAQEGLDLSDRTDFELYNASMGDRYLLNLNRELLRLQVEVRRGAIDVETYYDFSEMVSEEISYREQDLGLTQKVAPPVDPNAP